ncbi:hypothetical protein [Lysobacter sp. A289]
MDLLRRSCTDHAIISVENEVPNLVNEVRNLISEVRHASHEVREAIQQVRDVVNDVQMLDVEVPGLNTEVRDLIAGVSERPCISVIGLVGRMMPAGTRVKTVPGGLFRSSVSPRPGISRRVLVVTVLSVRFSLAWSDLLSIASLWR